MQDHAGGVDHDLEALSQQQGARLRCAGGCFLLRWRLLSLLGGQLTPIGRQCFTHLVEHHAAPELLRKDLQRWHRQQPIHARELRIISYHEGRRW